ncbi:MAG: hypothetical protein K2G69_08385 [Muribaculaceae bacterium]|nr:hypothetical protein [Muribaculaceae bacterium]
MVAYGGVTPRRLSGELRVEGGEWRGFVAVLGRGRPSLPGLPRRVFCGLWPRIAAAGPSAAPQGASLPGESLTNSASSLPLFPFSGNWFPITKDDL